MNDITNGKKEMAEALFYSLRGRYLMERAVVGLMKNLDAVELPYRESSDLADLTLIRTQLLNVFPDETFDVEKSNASL